MNDPYDFKPLDYQRLEPGEQERRLREFADRMANRRTVREFSSDPVPRHLLEEAIAAAGRAPSGANLQPWHFYLVENPEIKRQIREAAEVEERENYNRRYPAEMLSRVQPLGTNAEKPFLETAPFVIVAMKLEYGLEILPDGTEKKFKYYYVVESVGLACGFLLTALHLAGLATLTHTPSPMGFLCEILKAPKNYKPFLLIPVGYPADDVQVPVITKKPLDEILTRV